MKLENIKTIGICGIGQMGSALAVAFQRSGYHVQLWARNAQRLQANTASLDEMNQWCDKHLNHQVTPGGQITLEPQIESLDNSADVIFDCIIEVMSDKVELLKRFVSARQRGALFLTATSALSITEMAAASGLSELLVGAHGWNPPHIIPVVEIVRGDRTPESKVRLSCELMESIGKVPIVCKDVPGFIGNRLLHAMWRESLHMLDEGVCSAEDIDRVTRLTFALRLPLLGPIENMDYIGLDATERLQRFMAPRLANNQEPAKCLTEKLEAGDFGVPSGRGFYDWTKRDVNDLIRKRDAQVVRQLEYLKEIGEL